MSEEMAQEPKKKPGRPRKEKPAQESLALPLPVAEQASVVTEPVKAPRARRKPAAKEAEAAPVLVAASVADAPAEPARRKVGRPRKVVEAQADVPAPSVAPEAAPVPAQKSKAPGRAKARPSPPPEAVPAPIDAPQEAPAQAPLQPSGAAGSEGVPVQGRGPSRRGGRGQRGRGGQGRGGRAPGPGGRDQGRQGNPQQRRNGGAAPAALEQNRDPESNVDDDSGFDAEVESSSDAGRSRRRKGRERGGREGDSNVNWCTRRWLEQLEKYSHGHDARQRWARGKVYSRRGQVVELEVGPNGILAKVQGSRPKPYQVRMELNKLRREAWGRVLIAVSGKAHYTARLLAGEMPQEIESIFASSGARLFPAGEHDFRCKCSCPDPMTPCKHVSAVYHAMGMALEADPFLLFSLRGKSKNQFLQDLRDMRFRAHKGGKQAEYTQEEVAQMTSFWRMGRLTEAVSSHSNYEGGDPARLLHTLGDPPSTVVRAGMALPVFESTYRQVSEAVHRLPRTQ